jgi:hypothetical protein
MDSITRISAGEYEYKGFRLRSCGYSHYEHLYIWEVEDKNGGKHKTYSRREALKFIDESVDKQ